MSNTEENQITESEENSPDSPLTSDDLLSSSAVEHLVILHRVLYGTIDNEQALGYLWKHLKEDADLADFGRPLKFQYQPVPRG